ncbi:MAG: hypothetical protein O7C73_04290 [Nitrospirae bacterium]|nr:hypothetical protein [Nitrospirota bacterium]
MMSAFAIFRARPTDERFDGEGDHIGIDDSLEGGERGILKLSVVGGQRDEKDPRRNQGCCQAAGFIGDVEEVAEEPTVPVHRSLAHLLVEQRQRDERRHEPGRPEQTFSVRGFDPVGGVLVGPSQEPALARRFPMLTVSCFDGQDGKAKE